MQDTKALPPAIERILNRAQQAQHGDTEASAEEADVRGAFGEVRAPRAQGREALMLDVRRVDGQCHGLSYAYLMRVDYEPGDRLKLHFADAVVQVGGRRLQPLYRRLLEHRVEAIQEGTEAEEGLKPEDAPHIDRIELFDRMEADDEYQG